MANFRSSPDGATTPIIAPVIRWIPLGYAQAPVPASAQTFAGLSIAIPADAIIALISAEGAGVRYRDDGVAPTATVGMPLAAGQEFQYGVTDFTQIQFIQQAVGAVLNVAFYK